MIGIIDIIPVMIIISILWNAKLHKASEGTVFDNCLSVGRTKQYRGLFAIVVVLHHLSQKTTTGILFPCFDDMGNLAVAVFFFLTGYGLQKQYIIKGKEYRKGFLQKRISIVLIPYLIMTLIYWFIAWLFGDKYSLYDVIHKMIIGKPIVTYSWYIISVLIFYFVFWIMMLLCKRPGTIIALSFLWIGVYVVLCYKLGYETWWYLSSHLLIVGIIYGLYEKRITSIIKEHFTVIFLCVWTCFAALVILYPRLASVSVHQFTLTCLYYFIGSVLFAAGFLLLTHKVHIDSPALKKAGEISLDIYLSHGLFINLFQNIFPVYNDFLWCICVVVSTLVFSYIFHSLIKLLYKRISMVKKRTRHQAGMIDS